MKPTFLGLLFAIANTSALAQWFPPSPDTCTDYPVPATLENTPTITTEFEDIPTPVDPPPTTSTQNATTEQLSVHISVYESVYLELCSTGPRPVTATITETCIESASVAATGPRPDVTAAAFAEPASEPTSTYATLTVSRALASPASPGGSTTLTKTPGALGTAARPFTSNGGTANAAAFTSMPRRNATATIQPFSGGATIMYLNFPFAVSVMGIFVVSFCLL
ncbi:MAG: hypothetical protein M1840_005597 [Geoglossum simile]|nr:MAG: hypothetical protein M1840_005597 [Geoglossum simile]